MSAATRLAEWPAYRAILIQPVLKRRAQGTLWISWMLIVLMLGFAALAAAKPNKLVFAIGVGLPLGMLLLMWWGLYFSSILTQFNPIAAQLMPRMRERALRLTVALWAAMVLAMTLVVGVPTGYPGHVAVATGLVLLELTVMFSSWRFISLVAGNWLLLNAGPAVAGWYGAFLASNFAVALGLLLLVAEGRLALRRMFHTPSRLSSSTAGAKVLLVRPRLIGVLRIIAGDSIPSQPLITRVLGPSPFRGLRLVLVLVAAACAAMHGWVALHGGGSVHDKLYLTRFVMLMVLLTLQGLMVICEITNTYRRRSEQALVRLAPAAPSASQLNCFLARYRLLGFARMWLSMTALAAAALMILGATWAEAARAVLVCSFTLVFAGLLLRDYSRGGPSAASLFSVIVLFMAAAGAGTIAALRGPASPPTWLACALAAIILAALSLWRGWHSIAGAPPPYPAGRNSERST